MQIFEMILDEDQEGFGVNAVSLVKSPAILSDFVALSDQKPIMLSADVDKQILIGCALIPDKPIFRKGENGAEDYYIYFSKDTVAKTAQNFFRQGNQNNATLEHSSELTGMTIFESWIVEDTKLDKSAKYGLEAPEGTWCVAMKVDDDAIWEKHVKGEEVFGFSIEGTFANKLVSDIEMSSQKVEMSEDDILNETLEMIRTFVKESI